MSNLSELLPAGAGAKSADFVASGTLGSGVTVALKSDGTVEAVQETLSAPTITTENAYSYSNVSSVAYDSVNNIFIFAYYGPSSYLALVAASVDSNGVFTFGTPVLYSTAFSRFAVACNNGEIMGVAERSADGIFCIFSTEISSGLSLNSIYLIFGPTPSGESYASQDFYVEYNPVEDSFLAASTDGWTGNSFVIGLSYNSANNIGYGSPTYIDSGGTNSAKNYKCIYDPDNQKMLVFWRQGSNPSSGPDYFSYNATIITMSGTSVSVGNSVTISSDRVKERPDTSYNKDINKFISIYRMDSNEYATMRVVTVSGATISVGTEVSITAFGTEEYLLSVYDELAEKTFITYLPSGAGQLFTLASVNVSGTTPSLGLSSTYNLNGANFFTYAKTAYSTTDNTAFIFGQLSSQLKTYTVNQVSFNSADFIGITDQAIADTATGAVIVQGGVSEKLSGLTVGADYYVQADGSITTGGLPYDISSATYDNSSFSVSSQDTAPEGIAFSPDGTTMFIVGNGTDTVYQYALSSAFDISTASYSSVSFDLSSQATAPTGIAFNLSGTKMYVVSGGTLRRVYQYTLSTAFNVSTASYDSVFLNVGNESTAPQDIKLNSSGTKIYVLQSNPSDALFQYSLSTPYDLSTGSYDSVSLDVSSQESTPTGFDFNADGTKLFIVGSSGDDINQYSLSTAFDLSTASFDSITFDVSSQDLVPTGINFNSNGTTIYILGGANDSVYQYSTSAGSTTVPAGRALSTTSILLEG